MACLFRTCLLIGLLLSLAFGLPSAAAERWVCPDCPDSIVTRPDGAATLECPGCGKTYTQVDLAPPVAYVNFRTRDAEVAWMCETAPEKCTIYRFDGIKTEDGQGGDLWVPWSAVYWFIPRQRILKLVNGRELHTDYAMTVERCPEPSRFTFDTVDSLDIPGSKPSAILEHNKDVSLADLFFIAMSPEARDSARARFIAEVEAGKHPRLPRTHARLYIPASVPLTPDLVKLKFKGEATYEIKVHENRGTIKMRLLKGTGNVLLDEAAKNGIRASSFVPGGEMGVGVPSWTIAKVVFDGAGGAKVEEVEDPHGFWKP